MKLKWLIVIIIIAFFLRMGFALIYPVLPTDPNTGDAQWYFQTAKNLALGKGYVWPETAMSKVFGGIKPGTPTAYMPVGYPAFLGAIFHFTGASYVYAQITNAIISIFICIVTYLFSLKLFEKEYQRLTVLAITAFSPTQIIFSAIPMSDVLFVVLFLFSIYFLAISSSSSSEYLFLAFSGISMGLASLVRGQSSLMVVFIFLYFIFIKKFNFWQSAKKCFLIIIFLSLIVFPWVLRNYFVIGYPSSSTNGPIALYYGNNSNANGKYSVPPEMLVGSEVDCAKKSMVMAKAFIIEHPLKFILLMPLKAYRLFVSDSVFSFRNDLFNKLPGLIIVPLLAVSQILYSILWALFIFGLVNKKILNNDLTLLFLFVLAYWFFFHVIFLGGVRYNFPLMPIFVLLGFYSIWGKMKYE